MWIGVKDTVNEHLVQVGPRQRRRHAAQVVPLRGQTRGFRELGPLDLGEGDDAPGAVLPVDRGDAHLVLAEPLAQPVGVAPLDGIVQLVAQRVGELPDNVHELVVAQRLGAPLEEPRLRHEQLQVRLDGALHVGPPHLDDHLGAVMECGAVYLPDGRRGDGLLVKGGERRAQGPMQFVLDGGDDLVHRHGRRGIEQLAQLDDVRRGENVGTRAEDLPQLDVGRAEVLERPAHPLGNGQDRSGVVLLEGALASAGEKAQEAQVLRQEPQPVADEHLGDMPGPADLDHRTAPWEP